ncbi:DNA-binding protein [Halobacteriales archaeon QS_6_64_34]|nr:MAG: DNA-binding protein [Halobacteriales archaeon QS_6_64_34]
MSDASTKQSVECPICGDEFDPTVAGGWCTNTECGEWQYTEGSTESGGTAADDDVESTATADEGFISPDEDDADSESVNLFDDSDEGDDLDADDGVDDANDTAENPLAEEADGEEVDTDEVDADDIDDAAEEPSVDDDAEASEADDAEEPSANDDAEAPETDDAEAPETDDAEEVETDDEDEAAEEDDADETAADDEDGAADEAAADSIDCPDCGVELEADANFCVECGADVSGVEPGEATELDACPGCGADVEAEDNFCVNCGEDLDAHRADDGADHDDAIDALEAGADDEAKAPDSLVLEVEGREIHVDDGDTVGREIRAALTEAGRPDDEAVRIHREHVRFVREDGSFYLLDLGDNPTQINGQTLKKGDREQVAPGDELELSGVASVSVQAP